MWHDFIFIVRIHMALWMCLKAVVWNELQHLPGILQPAGPSLFCLPGLHNPVQLNAALPELKERSTLLLLSLIILMPEIIASQGCNNSLLSTGWELKIPPE